MHVGIDLGTTYSCVAYIDDDGTPKINPSSDGQVSTPSIIWFDGKGAFVGKKANDRKITPTSPIFEFIKRDMGKPKNPRYEVNGYYYGATGMAAIILRKLKKEIFNYFKKKGILPADAEEKSTLIPAVITVPAYFRDHQKQETINAGIAAGFDVISIINEPTAAALAYSRNLQDNKKIMVFDLGGGTFDVTILEIRDGEDVVKASDGADELGGKDWDELIMGYLYNEYNRKTGKDISDDLGWEIQQKAVQAKIELSENESTSVIISNDGEDLEIILHRNAPETNGNIFELNMDLDLPFYFEEISSDLLSRCRAICERLIKMTNLSWDDIDEIILAGGSCRMPMVTKMIEDLTGRKVKGHVAGFDYDTAIAIGAAIFGCRQRRKVTDVASKTIGIEVSENGRPYVYHLIHKNTPLPVTAEESFDAVENADFKIWEGDSRRIDECILRGRLKLGNPKGMVKVILSINEYGIILSKVEFPPDGHKELKIVSENDINIEELTEKIKKIDIHL